MTEPLTHAIAHAGLGGAPAEFDIKGDREVELDRRAPADGTALLQFTSGSSGRPRGVQVTYDNLETNIAQMQRWLGDEPRPARGAAGCRSTTTWA